MPVDELDVAAHFVWGELATWEKRNHPFLIDALFLGADWQWFSTQRTVFARLAWRYAYAWAAW